MSWNIGRLEYWNAGGLFKDQPFHHSMVPLFQGCLQTSNYSTNRCGLVWPRGFLSWTGAILVTLFQGPKMTIGMYLIGPSRGISMGA